jgi:hypothetical protein
MTISGLIIKVSGHILFLKLDLQNNILYNEFKFKNSFLETQMALNIDKTRQDKTRQDKTRQDKTRQDKTRQDKTRQDKTRQDK